MDDGGGDGGGSFRVKHGSVALGLFRQVCLKVIVFPRLGSQPFWANHTLDSVYKI